MNKVSIIVTGTEQGLIKFFMEIKEKETIGSLLKRLLTERPEIGVLVVETSSCFVKYTYNLLLNDRVFEATGDYEAVLKDGDVLTFLNAYMGG